MLCNRRLHSNSNQLGSAYVTYHQNLRVVERQLDPEDDYYKIVLATTNPLTVNFPDFEVSLDYQGSQTAGIEYEAVIFDDSTCEDSHQLAITTTSANDPGGAPAFSELLADEATRPFALTVDTAGGDPVIQVVSRSEHFLTKGTNPYPQYWDQVPESTTATLNVCVQLQIFHNDGTTRTYVNFVDVHVNIQVDMQQECDIAVDPTCGGTVTLERASVSGSNANAEIDVKLYCGPCLVADQSADQGRSVDICIWVDPVESPGVCLMQIDSMALVDGADTYEIFPNHPGIEVFDNLAAVDNCDDLNAITVGSSDEYPLSTLHAMNKEQCSMPRIILCSFLLFSCLCLPFFCRVRCRGQSSCSLDCGTSAWRWHFYQGTQSGRDGNLRNRSQVCDEPPSTRIRSTTG